MCNILAHLTFWATVYKLLLGKLLLLDSVHAVISPWDCDPCHIPTIMFLLPPFPHNPMLIFSAENEAIEGCDVSTLSEDDLIPNELVKRLLMCHLFSEDSEITIWVDPVHFYTKRGYVSLMYGGKFSYGAIIIVFYIQNNFDLNVCMTLCLTTRSDY